MNKSNMVCKLEDLRREVSELLKSIKDDDKGCHECTEEMFYENCPFNGSLEDFSNKMDAWSLDLQRKLEFLCMQDSLTVKEVVKLSSMGMEFNFDQIPESFVLEDEDKSIEFDLAGFNKAYPLACTNFRARIKFKKPWGNVVITNNSQILRLGSFYTEVYKIVEYSEDLDTGLSKLVEQFLAQRSKKFGFKFDVNFNVNYIASRNSNVYLNTYVPYYKQNFSRDHIQLDIYYDGELVSRTPMLRIPDLMSAVSVRCEEYLKSNGIKKRSGYNILTKSQPFQ